MKKYKQFRAEQQYITEVGPFASAMMGAMGIIGLGVGGWKLFKTAKEKIKGYRETKADKKARAQDGFSMSVKVYNPATDKEELQDFYVDPKEGNPDLEKLGYKIPKTLGGKIKPPSDDELDKMEKEAGKKAKRANAGIKKKVKDGTIKDDDLTTDQQTQLADKDKEVTDKKSAEDEKKRSVERKPDSYWVDKPIDDIPKGKKDKVKGLEAKEIKDGKGVLDWQDRWKTETAPDGWTKVSTGDDEDDFEYKKTADVKAEKEKNKQNTSGGSSTSQGKVTGQDTSAADKLLRRNDRILSFGEFITEGVMKDLLKAGKSKKDSEITLDDGADIPIDPLTSQILVKYIEGLSSSEKNRTIQQIQRTERAFMKVLGKAHENI